MTLLSKTDFTYKGWRVGNPTPQKEFLCRCVLLLLLFSCGSGENVKEGSEAVSFAKAVSFEKLDSIKIDYLGNPTVHDLDPVSRTVLFMEHKESSQLIAVANFEGEVLYSFTKWGDLPDSYGNLMAPLKIIGSDTFMAYGSRGFFTYTFDGKLQSIVKHANSQYRGFNRIGLGVGMEPLVDGYLYHNGNDGKRMPNGTEDYSRLMPLIFLYPSIGETTPVLHFPESSIFSRGNFFFNAAWDPAFTIMDGKIAVVFGLEPTVYVFDGSEPHSLLGELPLDLPDYRYFKGTDRYSSDVRFSGHSRTSGKIQNIKMVDGYIFIAYFPGLDGPDTEDSFVNKSPEEAVKFWKRMRKKYLHRLAVFDSVGNRMADTVLDGLLHGSMVIRNGELWMLEKPDEDVEQDYFRLFRVGLKREDVDEGGKFVD